MITAEAAIREFGVRRVIVEALPGIGDCFPHAVSYFGNSSRCQQNLAGLVGCKLRRRWRPR
jgi:hypothetical protein